MFLQSLQSAGLMAEGKSACFQAYESWLVGAGFELSIISLAGRLVPFVVSYRCVGGGLV